MKKILLTLALATAAVSTTFAQGFVIYSNPGNEKISTNAVAGGGATGAISAPAGNVGTTYYFALFYSATATTVSGSAAAVSGVGNYAFNDSNWTFNNPGAFAGYTDGPGYGTNLLAGQFQSTSIDASQSGTLVPFTTAAQFVVIGWSASDGTTLSQLMAWYNNGSPATAGWIGESIVSGAITPGNPNGAPASSAASLFGTGAGLLTKYTLGEVNPVASPEPATLALAGLGGLSMLLFRRRKS